MAVGRTFFLTAFVLLGLASAVGSASGAPKPVTSNSGPAGLPSLPAGPQLPTVVLYDQMNNPAPVPGGVTSQDFEAANDPFDSFTADDFVVPASQTWSVTGVDVAGEYSFGGGPAASVNVVFYANTGSNLPGAVVATRTGMPYVGGPAFSVTVSPAVVLSPGTYWVSVQARQDLGTAGQWFWDNRSVIANSGAAWQNPGGGFGVGCTTWGRKGPGAGTCLTTQNGPDQLFRLNGTQLGVLPEDFEGAPYAFTSSVVLCTPGGCGWNVVTTASHSPDHSDFAPDVNNTSDQRLVLNTAYPVPASATTATLTFWHRFAFEGSGANYYDGGVLEISTDGGTTWQDAGPNITSGGYNGTISSGFSNPLAGRGAWGQNPNGTNFVSVTVNLLPFKGDPDGLLFRFREGTDSSVAATGWWVDDVSITIGTPTAVAVASFTGRRAAGGVTLGWRTATEARLLGFNVWRSASGGRFAKLNARPIPASGAGSYRYVDGSARGERSYVYRLQTVGLDGGVRWAGRLSISRLLAVRPG